MAFNKYQWNLYLKAGGEKTVRRFEDFLNGNFEGYPEFVKELVSGFCPDEGIVQIMYEAAEWAVKTIRETIIDDALETISYQDENASDGQEATNALEMLKSNWETFLNDNPDYKKRGIAFSNYIFDMIDSTQIYAYIEPEVFFPYYFQQCFNVLSAIADYFEIELPPIPGKAQYMDRILYYGHLCNVFIDFANENDLTVEELWAFIYDYAPACVGGKEWVFDKLTEPHNIFVFGFGENYPENDPKRQWICQGSPDMQPGDIGILYHWAPDSCYTSIWRAISPGYYDPLGIHDRYVCYGHPILIPRITFAELKADPIFRETTLVKQSMLHMDGAPMLPSEYMHLLEMARSKGKVPDDVPTFDLRTNIERGGFILERDVEERLLEPFLLRLGWKPENWCRQMPVRIGRGISKYPDYVINPVYTKYNERGDIVLEAKLSIPSKKQAEHDRGQAQSYAKLLGAYAYVLISKEGIWISEKEDGFLQLTEYPWQDIENEDVFAKIYSILGNKKRRSKNKKDGN